MYILHIANKNYSSWSLRPWLLMKELGIEFEEKIHPFGNHNYLSFSPNGKVPCLHHSEIIVWDSFSIVEYLAESHKDVWPHDANARAWARSAMAEMHSGFNALREYCGMNVGLRVELHELPEHLLSDIFRISELWRQGIEKFGGPFLAGKNFTAVDAFFAPVVFRYQTYQFPLGETEVKYCKLLLSLKSMQLWENEALAETWMDQSHEVEVLKFGTVKKDYRLSSNILT